MENCVKRQEGNGPASAGTMTAGPQTRNGGSCLDAGVPNAYKVERFGNMNVRTMNTSGKLQEVDRVRASCNLAVLGISEVHWKGNGRLVLSSGSVFYFSGGN